jgi:hypothetical protein
VRAQAQLLVGESELKQKRSSPPRSRPSGQRRRRAPTILPCAIALSPDAGLALEEQGKLSEAIRYYDQVAADCPDKELRAWARTRKTAVAAQLKPQPPPDKPAPKPRAVAPR